MKRLILYFIGLIVVSVLLLSNLERNVLSQRQQDRYTVRVHNVDDVATVYVNSKEISRITYQNSDYQDITNNLRPGSNQIRLVVENYSEKFTYGFEINRGNETIFSFECGKLNAQGCGDDSRTGVVWEKIVTIDLPTPSLSVVVSNTIPIASGTKANSANGHLPTLRKRPADTSNIRQVDFKNFAYSDCEGSYGPTSNLINGRQKYGDSDHDIVELKAVKYVDFDGDGKEEAFITHEWSTSGSAGGGMNAYVFTMRNGEAIQIWSKCNERSGFILEGKSISYNYPEYVGEDAHCCPSYITTITFAWRKNGFAQIAKKRKASGY